jgi:tetratricopeptide (TPR) repeat protein
VVGAAGIGKSRLVREALRSIGERALVLQGRCPPYGEGITYWPLVEAVREASSITDGDTAADAYSKLANLVGDDPDAATITERVGAAVGLGGTPGGSQETFWAVRRLFETLSRRRPLVAVFDDIHWAEPVFLDLIEYLSGFGQDCPVLLVCVSRPDILDSRPSWAAGQRERSTIVLDTLDQEESARFVGDVVGGGTLPHAISARIVASSEGNPLFLQEMTRSLVDQEVLVRDGGGWAVTRSPDQIALPSSIKVLLASRLERLPALERAILQQASVVGEQFWWGAVSELTPASERPEVATCFQALVRKEFIAPGHSELVGEDAFRFGHILLQNAVYESIPKARRAVLHARHADWLERTAKDRIVEYEEIIGHHLECAYRYHCEMGEDNELTFSTARRASMRLASAARRSQARSDPVATANLLTRAAALLEGIDPSARLELLPDLGLALAGIDNETAARVLREAIQGAVAIGARGVEMHARIAKIELEWDNTPQVAEQARSLVEEAVAIFQESGDDLGLARAWSVMADIHGDGCEPHEFADAVLRAAFHAGRANNRWEEAEYLAAAAHAFPYDRTRADKAITRSEEILERVKGFPTAEIAPMQSLGLLYAMREKFDYARELMTTSRAMYKDLWGRSGTGFWHGWVETLAGDLEAAEQVLRQGYEERLKLGESPYGRATGLLALVLFDLRQYEDARQFAAITREVAENDCCPQYFWRAAEARLLAREGRFDDAIRLAREAIGVTAGTDVINEHASLLMNLAQVLREGDQEGPARSVMGQAMQLYEEKGNLASLAWARRFVDSLSR